jgi:hypothetical protein
MDVRFLGLVALLTACPGDKPDGSELPGGGDASFGVLRYSDRFLRGEDPDPLYPLGAGTYATPGVSDVADAGYGYRLGGMATPTFVPGRAAGFPWADGFVAVHPRSGTWIERQSAQGAAAWSIGGEASLDVVSGSAGDGVGWFTVTSTGALPALFGGPRTPEEGYETVLARVNLQTGAIEAVVDVGQTGVYGSVLALPDGGVAYASAIGGVRHVDGRTYGRLGVEQALVEVFDADGRARWRRVIGPDARLDRIDLTLGAEGELLLSARALGSVDLGQGLLETPSATHGLLVAYDGDDGTLRWSRQDAQASTARAAVRADGWVAWVRDLFGPVDLGGTAGRIEGLPVGSALAAVLLDRCGVAQAARVWTYCDCYPDQEAGYVSPFATAWSPEGSLWMSAESDGAVRFAGEVDGTLGTTDGDVIGGDPGEVSWVVEVSGPSGSPGDCTLSPPPEPTVRLRLQGAGSVTARRDDGEVVATCSADCDVVAPRHEPLFLTATAAEGFALQGWGGACSGGEGCTLLHDADSEVTATFGPSALDGVVAMQGAVSDARLAVGVDGRMWAAIATTDGLSVGARALAAPGLTATVVVAWDAEGQLLGYDVGPWSTPVAVVPELDGGATVVRVVGGLAEVTRYDALAVPITVDQAAGVNQDVRWATDVVGTSFLVENQTFSSARVLRADFGAWSEVATLTGGPLLVQDAVGLDAGVAITVNHGANANLAGVALAAAGTALVVLDGDGARVSVTALPFGVPTGLLKPSEGLPWGPDLALFGLGDRFGGGGYHLEPIGTDGGFLGGGWTLPLLDVAPSVTAREAARPLGAAVWVAGGDDAVFGVQKAAIAVLDGPVERWREVARGTSDDRWHATASDGVGTAVGLLTFGAGSSFGGVPVQGLTLVRVAADRPAAP